MSTPPVLVAAGVLVEGDRVLLTQRKAGSHLGGTWELPGGKVDPGEDPRDTVARELREELGVDVTVGEPVEVTYFEYPEKAVLLLFFAVTRRPGSPEPRALDVADLLWASRGDLDGLTFPPADVAVLERIRARLTA